MNKVLGVPHAIILRLYPNRAQAASLRQWTGGLRFAWNKTLTWCNDQRTTTGKWPRQSAIQSFIVRLKKEKETEWLSKIPSHSLLSLAADLDRAFSNWFSSLSGKRKGPKIKKPKFRSKYAKQHSVYMVNQATQFEDKAVKLPKLGRIKWRGGDLPEGKLLSSRVYQEARKWYMASVFDCDKPKVTVAAIEMVGIDMGLSRLATVYDGKRFFYVDNPKALQLHETRLKRYQRRMSRRVKGSHRRYRAGIAVAKQHQKIANTRKDNAHKATSIIVENAQIIKVETLNIKGMMQNRHIAKSVADAGMGMFINMLAYKADRANRTFIKADRWFASSKTCSVCGKIHDMPLHKRWFSCDCGNEIDRDENAAVNLFAYREELGNVTLSELKRAGRWEVQNVVERPSSVPIDELRILKWSGSVTAGLK